MRPFALLALLLLGFIGCDSQRYNWIQTPSQPQPVVDLPREMRVTNWIGRGAGGHSGGSCVHASTLNSFRSSGRFDLESRWAANRDRGYEGPETGSGILDKLSREGVPYAYTSDGDIRLLEAATETRRDGMIFYYPSHCVNFQQFAMIDGRECAVLLDNNFPDQYIVIDRDTFERSWRHYGGFACIPWLDPVAPRSFPRMVPRG